MQLELAAGSRTESGRYLYDTAAIRQTEMDGGADLLRQRQFADQARQVLAKLNFVEAVGYDNRADTRLLGTIPAGRLDALLNDLRFQPEAWRLEVRGGPRIDGVLLAGLRSRRGGEAVLDGILGDWEAFFERKKRELGEAPKGDKPGKPAVDDVIGKLVAAWAKRPAAAEYLKGLPPEVQASGTITRGLLLAHLVRHPDSTVVLQAAWKDALASPFAPDLLALVLRRLPQTIRAELPVLLRTDSPVRVTEVQTNLPPVAAPFSQKKIAKGDEKLTPDLTERLTGANAATPLRLDVILALAPDESDRTWQRELQAAAPGLVIEGRVGPLVSVKVLPGQVRGHAEAKDGLVNLPIVSAIRLPRSGEPRRRPRRGESGRRQGAGGQRPGAAAQGAAQGRRRDRGDHRRRLPRLGGAGRQGAAGPDAPVRPDGGAQRQPEARRRAGGRRPRPRHRDRPRRRPGRAGGGAGPGADRPGGALPVVDRGAALNGAPNRSLNLALRAEELQATRAELAVRRAVLHKTRAVQLEKSPDVSQKPLLLKKKEKMALTADEQDLLKDIEEFETYKKDQAKLDADEREYQDRVKRRLRLEGELRDLRKVRVVATGLAWDEGMPVDGGGALSRYFDDEPFKKAVWFQAAGDTRGQAWAGLFRDGDGDGVMEFLPSGTHLPPGAGTGRSPSCRGSPPPAPRSPTFPPERSCGCRSSGASRTTPTSCATVRTFTRARWPRRASACCVRWTRGREAAGRRLPGGRPDGRPAAAPWKTSRARRCTSRPSSSPWPWPGADVLRVEGSVPATIRPADEPTVPAAEQTWELRCACS